MVTYYGTSGMFVFGLFEVDAEDAGHGGDVSIVEAEHGVAVSVGVPQKLRCRQNALLVLLDYLH